MSTPALTQSRGWTENTIPFTADDGYQCNLIHVEGAKSATKGPVILVHGAGVRANIFRSPVASTVVDALIEDGFDVWLENWRASIDLIANEWTLDDAAVNDHPAAIRSIQEHTGAREVKAIVHCQGSTSFVMSACAGLLPNVTTIVANALSLHTVVPKFSEFKLEFAVPLMRRVFPYLNPQWGLNPPDLKARLLRAVVELFHHECHNPVCKFSSFTYGTGFPVLWRHENLNDETHEWLTQEFAKVPLTFFSQMAECVRRGNLVSLGKYRQLPSDYCAQAPQTDARFVLLAGEKNVCFLPAGQRRSFEFLDGKRKDYHSIHFFPTYGHLDVFMGKDAYRDTFPVMLQELNRTN
jgi:pimeloyl-ACP methyl ester carboxylesterase